MPETRVLRDADALSRAAAERFVEAAAEAIASSGRFVVALAGGSTPRGAYERLASVELAPRVDWSRVHVFWGDERCVPPDHPDSNYRMAREALLDRVPVPDANVHRVEGERRPEEAAASYERVLRAFFTGQSADGRTAADAPTPCFDLILLGMGQDGHTASLFPGDRALAETERWVAAVRAPDVAPRLPRVTLTLPVINASNRIFFIVSGSRKRKVLRSVLDDPEAARALYPPAMVRPCEQVIWFVDEAAIGHAAGGRAAREE